MQSRTVFILGGALAALALGGCNNSQPASTPPPTTTVVNPPPPATTTTVTTVPGAPDTKINNNAGPGTSNGTDQATADAVNTAIVHNKEMTGSRVDAVVTGGVARLTGTVQNQQQKALAAAAASKTPGVTSVVNKLIIDGTGGVHTASATPKVVNHTTIINHYITVPATNGSGGSGSGGTTDDNGNGSGASGGGTNPTGDNSSGTSTSGSGSAPDASAGGATGGGTTGGQ